MSQQHGYDYTLNSYMSKVSRPRGEWGKNKTYIITQSTIFKTQTETFSMEQFKL